MSKEVLIKSKARVKKFAEVFTPQHIVENMVSAVGEDKMFDPETTVLEPSVGTGNFFIYILRNRLARIPKIHSEENIYKVLRSVDTLYGIEIQEDNVKECQDNLWSVCEEYFKQTGAYMKPDFQDIKHAIYNILERRIKHGDFLKITGVKDENGKYNKKPLSDEEARARIWNFFNQ